MTVHTLEGIVLAGVKASACGLLAEVQVGTRGMSENNHACSFQHESAKKEGETSCVWFFARGR